MLDVSRLQTNANCNCLTHILELILFVRFIHIFTHAHTDIYLFTSNHMFLFSLPCHLFAQQLPVLKSSRVYEKSFFPFSV